VYMRRDRDLIAIRPPLTSQRRSKRADSLITCSLSRDER
jgi:hypothetical protein